MKKFRVWDEISKKMYYFGDGKYSLDMGGRLFDDSQKPPLCVDYRCKVMFSTGLLDKNGKEIYEGDILGYENIFYDPSNGDSPIALSLVKWGNTFWELGKCKLSSFESQEVEILGNIHENPDFLNIPNKP